MHNDIRCKTLQNCFGIILQNSDGYTYDDIEHNRVLQFVYYA